MTPSPKTGFRALRRDHIYAGIHIPPIVEEFSPGESVNTHKVLARAGYSKRPDYGDIAREVAMLVKHNSLSEQELLAAIASKFGAPPPRVEMRDKALPFAMYGDPGVDFDYGAVEQMRKVMRLPVTVGGAMMPDAHLGMPCPLAACLAPRWV